MWVNEWLTKSCHRIRRQKSSTILLCTVVGFLIVESNLKFLGVLLRSAVLNALRFRESNYGGCGRGEHMAAQSGNTVTSHCATSHAEARGEDI